MDCGSVEHENNLQLFIRGNGAHGNRVTPNCARFDLEKKRKEKKIRKSEEKDYSKSIQDKKKRISPNCVSFDFEAELCTPDASLTPGLSF